MIKVYFTLLTILLVSPKNYAQHSICVSIFQIFYQTESPMYSLNEFEKELMVKEKMKRGMYVGISIDTLQENILAFKKLREQAYRDDKALIVVDPEGSLLKLLSESDPNMPIVMSDKLQNKNFRLEAGSIIYFSTDSEEELADNLESIMDKNKLFKSRVLGVLSFNPNPRSEKISVSYFESQTLDIIRKVYIKHEVTNRTRAVAPKAPDFSFKYFSFKLTYFIALKRNFPLSKEMFTIPVEYLKEGHVSRTVHKSKSALILQEDNLAFTLKMKLGVPTFFPYFKSYAESMHEHLNPKQVETLKVAVSILAVLAEFSQSEQFVIYYGRVVQLLKVYEEGKLDHYHHNKKIRSLVGNIRHFETKHPQHIEEHRKFLQRIYAALPTDAMPLLEKIDSISK